MTSFGILVFDGVEELGLVGPWDVFAESVRARARAVVREAGREVARSRRADPAMAFDEADAARLAPFRDLDPVVEFAQPAVVPIDDVVEVDLTDEIDEVVTIAPTSGVVRCANGLRLLPDHTIDDHPQLDVVLVPGGPGTDIVQEDEEVLEWLRVVDMDTTWTASVCTGSALLHRSGLADRARLATHRSFEDTLAADGALVERRYRWVVDGKMVSSQGVSAGIDMALWLVGDLHGPSHARAVQDAIQYDPAPPYQHAV